MLLTRPVPTLSEPKKTPAVPVRVIVLYARDAVVESVTVPVTVWIAAAGALTARATAIGDRAALAAGAWAARGGAGGAGGGGVGPETAMLAPAAALAQLIVPSAPASPVSKAPS